MPVSGVDATTAYTQAVGATQANTGTTSTTGTSTSTTATNSTDSNQQLFLSLLTAQLKYQDPSNTTDPSELISQTAMFQQLSQLSAMSTELTSLKTQLASVYTNQTNYGASSLVGKEVSYTNSAGTKATGTVSGVTFSSNGPQFTVGDDTVAMANLLGVNQSVSTSGTSTT